MSLIDENSRGVFAIAVTPFTEDGVVDLLVLTPWWIFTGSPVAAGSQSSV